MEDDLILGFIPGKRRAVVFITLLAITLALMISMQIIGGPLQTEVAPAGIVSYELAGNLGAAEGMIASWGTRGQVLAGLSLGMDFLFLVAYSVTIALGCLIVTRRLHPRFRFLIRLGGLLSWAQFLAAGLDAMENYALIRVLLGSTNGIWPPVALWCALPKFTLVLVGILYVVVVALMTLMPRNRAT